MTLEPGKYKIVVQTDLVYGKGLFSDLQMISCSAFTCRERQRAPWGLFWNNSNLILEVPLMNSQLPKGPSLSTITLGTKFSFVNGERYRH